MKESTPVDIFSDPEVIVYRRDPNKPVKLFRPVIRVKRPISLAELLQCECGQGQAVE